MFFAYHYPIGGSVCTTHSLVPMTHYNYAIMGVPVMALFICVLRVAARQPAGEHAMSLRAIAARLDGDESQP
jgi:hypothetical protein